MKLKAKRLLAAALAISLTANISLAAFAVTYDGLDGDVTVTTKENVDNEGDGSDVYSYQNDEDSGVYDSTVIVVQGDDAYDAVSAAEEKAKEDGDNLTADDVAGILEELRAESDDKDNTEDEVSHNSIIIDDDVKGATIIVGDVDIEIDETSGNDAAIEVGDNSDVNIDLVGDNDITLSTGTSSGIEIGEGSDVTITVDGTTNITASDKIANEVGTGNMTVGIAVGGGAYDGSGSSSTDDNNDAVKSKVVITGTENKDDVLNIKDTSVGILVHDGTELVIGDVDGDENKETIEVNIDGAERTYDANDDNKDFYTVSGKGIMSYGDLTITDNATVNIDDSDVMGINVIGGDLEVSGGAQVSVTDTGKSNNLKADTGDSTTYAGIYVETGSNTLITGKGTSVNVSGNNVTSAGQGISSEGGDGTKFEVTDGATVTVNNVKEEGISIGGNQEMIITNNGIVNISKAAAGLYLNPGSTLYVKDYDGKDKETDSSKLVISNITGNGISADNASIEIGGQYALVTIDSVVNASIGLSGTTPNKYLKVYDSSNLNITNVGYVGIVVGDDGYGGTDYYKTVEILSDAIVTITANGSNSVILYGGENTLTVDNATLDAGGRISMYGGKSITVDAETYKEMFNITDDGLTEDVELGVETAYPSGQSTVTVTVKDPETGENTVYYYIVDFEKQTFTEAEKNSAGIWTPVSGATPIPFPEDAVITPHTSEVVINNGSKVTASAVRDYSYHSSLKDIYGAAGKLIVNGGTLEFTKNGTSSNDCDLSYDDAETLKNEANGSPDTWAVSGDENGGEELTNFKVSISYLKGLQESLLDEEENDDISEKEFFDKYGFVITSGEDDSMKDVKGNLVDANQLIIKTYGYENGNYIPYNEDGKNGTDTTWYVVDLNKDYDEDGELWIWTPAIVLSYYALNEDKGLEDAEDYSESNPKDPVTNEVATRLTVNHDVIYRGGSLIFDSFKIDESLKTLTGDAELRAYDEALNKLKEESYSGYSGLKIYNAYTTDDGWEDFDDETIVLLAEVAEGTNFGYKNLFAPVKTDEPEEDPTNPPSGGGDPEPIPETEPDPEPGTPETEPREPEEPLESDTPVVPVVPVTPETPAQPETPAETPADPEAPAETPETPASSTPKTGDDSNVAIYLVMAALSGAALIGLGVTGKKKNEEV